MKSVALLFGVAACALTSKAPTRPIHYFSADVSTRAMAVECDRTVRIGRVTSSSHLRYRVVQRRSPVEVELADSLRWTDYPEAYVKRSLRHALGAHEGIDSASPVVTLDLVAFDDVTRSGRHYGRVVIDYEVANDARVLGKGSLVHEHPSENEQMNAVAAALSRALESATRDLTARVLLAAGCEH